MITLKTLAQATRQQVFDQVVTHMRAQKVQSMREDGDACVYRAGELKCAAGCLMTDEEYNPLMDVQSGDNGTEFGTSWSSLINRELVPSTDHDDLITRLQSIHDAYDGNLRWEARFEGLAKEYNLQFTPL